MLPPEIIEERRGNITASEGHCIMAGWDKQRPTDEYPTELYDWIALKKEKPLVRDVKGFLPCEVSSDLIGAAWQAYQFDNQKPPQGLITYAETLASEELFYSDPSVDDRPATVHMENGNIREADAVILLNNAVKPLGIEFLKTGEDQTHISANGIGATPDGIAFDALDLPKVGAEIKARIALNHMRELFIVDNATLMELDFKRFCQIQIGCLVLEVDEWYSVSYNPFAIAEADQLHYCIIKRDDAFLEIFKKRAAMVFEHKALIIDRVRNRKLPDLEVQAA